MVLSPPGGLRAPRTGSLVSAFPSANMSLPVISLSLALLRGFSADPGGTSPWKILFPESSANFWSCIFFDGFLTGASPNKMLLWPPAGCKKKVGGKKTKKRMWKCSYAHNYGVIWHDEQIQRKAFLHYLGPKMLSPKCSSDIAGGKSTWTKLKTPHKKRKGTASYFRKILTIIVKLFKKMLLQIPNSRKSNTIMETF